MAESPELGRVNDMIIDGKPYQGESIFPELDEPRLATSVIPVRDGKVLVGQRNDGTGCWQFAGGKPEPGETLHDCAIRELREETGLEAVLLTEVGPFTVEHRGTRWTVHFYEAIVEGEATHREPDKSLGWKWVEWDDLPRPMLPGSEALLATDFRPQLLDASACRALTPDEDRRDRI